MVTRRRGGAPKGTTGANTLEYKGYVGLIEYDDEAGKFHGEVVNLRGVVTFEGECVEELRTALRDSVEDYLEFCAERGEEPEWIDKRSSQNRLRLMERVHV
jgi:predicted HicB family RNase H-like nuclease